MTAQSITHGTTMPLPDSPFLEEFLSTSNLSPADRHTVRDYAQKGYAVIDVGLPDFDAVADRLLANLAPKYPANDRRIMEAWYFDEDVRKIACAPKVLDFIKLVYQRDAFPFQTLNFDHGTSQPSHSDTIHFHSVPRHFMVGVWVAFEDIHPDSGPLFVHPGSHKLPDYDMHDLGLPSSPDSYLDYEKKVGAILKAKGFEREPVLPKRGQAVVWSANLFHGGMPVKNKALTRHSQATHYYFDDCMYYFPMGSEPFAGRMVVREAINIMTGEMLPLRYRDRQVHLTDYKDVLTYPRPLPSWVKNASAPKASEPDDPQTAHLRQRIRDLEAVVQSQRSLSRVVSGVRKKVRGLLGES